MSKDLPQTSHPKPLSPALQELAEEAQDFLDAGVPYNTRRTYRAQWTNYVAWCKHHGLSPIPADGKTLILYLTARAREAKVPTLNVALSAIAAAHREAGFANWSASDQQGVRAFMRGLRRKKHTPPEKKEPFHLPDLIRGLPAGKRDRALLLVGYFSAMRRSELVAIDIEDLKAVSSGCRIYIPQSKTDKDSSGQIVFIPEVGGEACPVGALVDYLKKVRRKKGPLFTSHRSSGRLLGSDVNRIVKKAAKQAGLDPNEYGAHSLRAGFATDAASYAEERDIMRVTRHTSERTVREYIREGTLGATHPGKKIVEALLNKD